MAIGPVQARLREATGPLHERLDSELCVVERLSHPDRRPVLIAAYAYFHRSMDEAMRAARGPEALGVRYVLEGSNLGGKVIRKALASQGVSLHGLDFLDPHGDGAVEAWRTFLAVLEDKGAADPAAVERGAVAAFALAEACLTEPA